MESRIRWVSCYHPQLIIGADTHDSLTFTDSPPSSHLAYYTRLFNLLVQSNRDLLQRIADSASGSDVDADDEDSSTSAAYQHISRTLLPILTLTQTLYLSPNEHHSGQGIIGEELLHWLNSYDLAPTTEQGREIASDAEPYLHPSYWDYILRCTLRGFHSTVSTMLGTLLSLPSSSLQSLVSRIRDLIKVLPRSVNYKTEIQFKSARRDFHLKLMGILSSLEAVMDEVQDEIVSSGSSGEEDAEDLRLSLEAGLRVFLEVLAGNVERVVEAAEDWKEALAAFATLVDVGLKRDGLSDAMGKIQTLRDEQQVEDPSEQVMIHLIKGQVQDACTAAKTLDPYLTQMLVDYSIKLGITDPNTTTRDHLYQANLVYANTLLSTYGLWRMAIDYLSYAGEDPGRKRMSEVVVGVPLLEERTEDDASPSSEFHLVESILSTCSTFSLLREARSICKKISLHLIGIKRFGPAVVYALRSPPRGDETLMKMIVGSVLDGVLRKKSKGGAHTTAHATWLIEQVTEIKLWIIRAAREEEQRRYEEGDREDANPAVGSAFLSRRKGGPLPTTSMAVDGGPPADDDALLLELLQEEEWNHHFSHSLPSVLRFLTNLSHYFELKRTSAPSTAAFLVELLNSGLVPGDWVSVCLYEVGSAPLDSGIMSHVHLYEILRIVQTVESNASLTPAEEEWALGKLGRWISPGGGDKDKEDEHVKRGRITGAREEIKNLRLKIALGLTVGGVAAVSLPSVKLQDSAVVPLLDEEQEVDVTMT